MLLGLPVKFRHHRPGIDCHIWSILHMVHAPCWRIQWYNVKHTCSISCLLRHSLCYEWVGTFWGYLGWRAQIEWNLSLLRFLSGSVNLSTKIKKILSGGTVMLDINELYLTYFLTSVFEAEALAAISMDVSWAFWNWFLHLKVEISHYIEKENCLL